MSLWKQLFGKAEPQKAVTAASDSYTITSEQSLRNMGALAEVNGAPTYTLSDQKDDLKTMLLCCDAEEQTYWRQPEEKRLCAAPFYFERAAILFKKQKNYAAEVSVCERWVAIMEDYKCQPDVVAGRAALVHKGPRSIAIYKRIPKARAMEMACTNPQ